MKPQGRLLNQSLSPSSDIDRPWDEWPGFSSAGSDSDTPKVAVEHKRPALLDDASRVDMYSGAAVHTNFRRDTKTSVELGFEDSCSKFLHLRNLITQQVIENKPIPGLADQCSKFHAISLHQFGSLNPDQATSLISLIKDTKSIVLLDLPHLETSGAFSNEKKKWFYLSFFEQMSKHVEMQDLSISIKDLVGDEGSNLYSHALSKLVNLKKINFGGGHAGAAAAITNKPKLEVLKIRDGGGPNFGQFNFVSDRDEQTIIFFNSLQNCPALKVLDMADSWLVPRSVEYLIDLLPAWKDLVDLQIRIHSTPDDQKRKPKPNSYRAKSLQLNSLSVQRNKDCAAVVVELLKPASRLKLFEYKILDPLEGYFKSKALNSRNSESPNLLFSVLTESNQDLKVLKLDRVRISNHTIDLMKGMFAKLYSLETVHIEELDFEGSELSLAEFFDVLSILPSMTSLKWGFLEWASQACEISDPRVLMLTLPSIREMDFQAGFKDQSMIWPNMPRLESLKFRGKLGSGHLPDPLSVPALRLVSAQFLAPDLAQEYANKFLQGHVMSVNGTVYTSRR